MYKVEPERLFGPNVWYAQWNFSNYANSVPKMCEFQALDILQNLRNCTKKSFENKCIGS